MILTHYTLNKETWRRFFEAHYAADRSLKIRYAWGVVCIVIGALGFAGVYDQWPVAGLLMATGLFAVLSRQLLVVKSLRSARRHPFYGKAVSVCITPGELVVRSGDAGYDQPWTDFTGYRETRPGFLFYHDASSFFFIPIDALSAEQQDQLRGILDRSGLHRLDGHLPDGRRPS